MYEPDCSRRESILVSIYIAEHIATALPIRLLRGLNQRNELNLKGLEIHRTGWQTLFQEFIS